MSTPREAVEKKERLTAEHTKLTERMIDIVKEKGKIWLDMRAELKTDTQANRAYDASPLGIEEAQIKLRMKSIDKEISSVNSIIRNAENEAKNLY